MRRVTDFGSFELLAGGPRPEESETLAGSAECLRAR
jgi:hypothetical protein